MRYVKKPPIVEAYQYGFDRKPAWMIASEAIFCTQDGAWLLIPTPNGDMKAMLGDFIVKDSLGNIFPMPQDVFKATYEKVLES